MTNEELKTTITELVATAAFDETGEWLNVVVDPKEWLTLALQLQNHHSLYFDYLFCVTCIDWKTHLTMAYHLSSTSYRHNIVIKINLDREAPEVETVSTYGKLQISTREKRMKCLAFILLIIPI